MKIKLQGGTQIAVTVVYNVFHNVLLQILLFLRQCFTVELIAKELNFISSYIRMYAHEYVHMYIHTYVLYFLLVVGQTHALWLQRVSSLGKTQSISTWFMPTAMPLRIYKYLLIYLHIPMYLCTYIHMYIYFAFHEQRTVAARSERRAREMSNKAKQTVKCRRHVSAHTHARTRARSNCVGASDVSHFFLFCFVSFADYYLQKITASCDAN